MMTDLDYDGMKNGEFKPWLLQVIESRRYEVTPRVTLAEAREAWARKLDLLEGSGIPRKVAQFCDDLFGWHYMGNAEYEWGSIPTAIRQIFEHELVTRGIHIPKSKLPDNSWARERPRRKGEKKTELPEKQDLTLYYLGPKKYAEHLDGFIKDLCAGKVRTKAGHYFEYMADPISEYDQQYQGWLCLDYPFWMTKNKAIWEKLVELYTGKVP